MSVSIPRWDRYPRVAQSPDARSWLTIQANLGLSQNTIEAYGRALEDFLSFSADQSVTPEMATREHIATYVRDLSARRNSRRAKELAPPSAGLANATIQQRLTAVRLYYDYLMEEGKRSDNPVGRGRYTPGKAFGSKRERGLVPHYHKLPWLPNEEQWCAVLAAARSEPLRNRVMLAMSYDAALRREELCSLAVADIDPSQRLLRIRAETTKNHQERVVPYSSTTAELFSAYLQHRRELSRERGPLFISESRRNRGQPISIWTWSKVVQEIATRAGVRQFTTHTPRHLCLTDLARADWDIHEIARFAGHRNIQTTLRYIHLSGRELATKFENGMAALHAWRVAAIGELLK
jgi:integrase/recombinase XerD